MVCKNGHLQRNTISKFCIYCGTPLQLQSFIPQNPAPPIPQQTPLQPAPTPQLNQFNQAQVYQNLPIPPAQFINQVPPTDDIKPCGTCGGKGKHLNEKILICKECEWLRPLAPGYEIAPEAFQWAEDGKAMATLRSITPLKMAAEVVSDKVGRRWIETMFNGVLLGEKQLPQIYFQAVHAARLLGMNYMPDIYVSGELMWDCKTYGSDKDSFIIMGSALATNFRGPELLFLFAREMGHCRTGHALWKTVIRFLIGEQRTKSGLMGGGLFGALGKVLSPSALLSETIEVPLMAWARQAEITADRAGMLALGNEDIVRRVLLSWSLKSPILQRQINVEEWLKQQSVMDDDVTKLSELISSSTPYITRRLKLLTEFAQSPELGRWRAIINQHTVKNKPENKSKKDEDIRLKCATCGTPMRIPGKVFEGKTQLSIRCPDAKCGKMTFLKKQAKPAPKGDELSKKEQRELERNLNYGE